MILRASVVRCAAACALATIAASPYARADESAAAQSLFDDAKKDMARHDYADACPKLEESLRLQEALGTLLNLALCYEQQGRLASAWSKFLEVAAKARASGQSERARIGRDRAAALAPKLSHLVVDVPPASRAEGLEIRRDGTALGAVEWGTAIPADPGPHTVEVSAPGKKPWSSTVTVPGGASTARLEIPALEALPDGQHAQRQTPSTTPPPAGSAPPAIATEPPPSTPEQPGHGRARDVVTIAVAGVGAAGIAAGAVFGLLSLSKHNDATHECPPRRARPRPASTCGDKPGTSATPRTSRSSSAASASPPPGPSG